MVWGWALWVICAAGAASAGAADVTMELSSRETYVGVPITVRINIDNAKQQEAPVVPSIPDVTVRSAGVPNRSSQTTIVNGQMSQKITVSYDYQLTPQKPGPFTIPAIEVQADGQKHHTEPVAVVVVKSETGDLLFVDLKGKRSSLYVGEPLEATLQIWIKPYLDRRFQVKLSEADMWSRVDPQNSQWGVFLDTLQELASQRQRPRGQEAIRKDSHGNDRSYYLYELNKTVWPQRPGKIDVGEINVIVAYPMRLERSTAIFSMRDLVIADTRPATARVLLAPIEVKPIPTEGRPPWFRGAVGRYDISATAKPTEVAVGDPITLTLSITGTGRLDELQSPPLPDIEELTRDFKVPTDPLAGEVQATTKQFSQSIRAKSDRVTAIASIPFAYFDPQRAQFVTVRTKPIPLKVKPVEKLSAAQIVDSGTPRAEATRSLTEVSGGILANYTGMDEVLIQEVFAPGWTSAVTLTLGPLAFAASWLVQRRRDRLRHDVSFARRRSAKRDAKRRLHAAAGMAPAESVAAAAAAISGYVADQCNLPAGGLTRAEVIAHLTQRHVSESLIREIDKVLDQCENLRYAAGGASSGEDVLHAATRCIDLLERERF